MTKKDIVRLVSEKTDLSQQQVKEIVQLTLESIIHVLVRDGRIELRNFGVFKVKERVARNARNPRTGEEVHVPQHETVAFKPGKLMISRVQGERRRKASAKKNAVKKSGKSPATVKATSQSTGKVAKKGNKASKQGKK
jgi:DNA-binding protein HU-beta/integration host factor subunit beta